MLPEMIPCLFEIKVNTAISSERNNFWKALKSKPILSQILKSRDADDSCHNEKGTGNDSRHAE